MTTTMMTTTMTTTELDTRDRDALRALAESWGARVIDLEPLGREAGGSGMISGWRMRTAEADGTAAEHVLYLDDSPTSTGAGAVLTAPDGRALHVWRHPDDPVLTALPALAYPDAARVVLDRLGIRAQLTDVRLASYRPGKRAVVQLSTTAGDLFAKVVAPHRVDDILGRHREWHAAGLPSPPVAAWSRDGIVVLGALAGRPAASVLPDVDLDGFAASIRELRARIARVATAHAARTSPAARVSWYLRRAAELSAGTADDLRAITAAVARWRPAPTADEVTVHGDLHLGQLLVDPESPTRLVGVLDVDTSGRGDPADDDAALVAHLLVMAHRRSPAAARLVDAVLRSARSDPPARRDRAAIGTAALLLGHGLSGHLPLPDAVALARAVAENPDENPLISVSSSPHPHPGS